jgi:hypothetical protein
MLLLFSFVWVAIYPVTNSMVQTFDVSYGNMLNTANPNFSFIVTSIFVDAIYSLIIFELVFYLYRSFLGFKIYSFIVPNERLKAESRIFYVYRNLIIGLFLNLCFIFPYLYIYAELLSLIVTLTMLIIYANRLNKRYAEPVIGHFVFKNFCFPLFVYEALFLIIELWGVLA